MVSFFCLLDVINHIVCYTTTMFSSIFILFLADGDNAWICWNDALLACLPKSVEYNWDVSDKVSEPKFDNCFWDSSIKDILEYCHHFRNHQKFLSSYSDLLDVSIDRYGFDDMDGWSKELGLRAFYQVRASAYC